MLSKLTATSISLSGHRLAVVVALGVIAGCGSIDYRAKQLPSEFRQAESKRGTQIDLSHVTLAGTSDSVIAPSDLLEVTVTTGYSQEKAKPIKTRVANNGTVDIPLIGRVPVAGLEVFEASENIANMAVERGIYLNPHVMVEIKAKSVNRVTVLGAVKKPGVHELSRGACDLVNALAAAGGFTDEADTIVDISRASPGILSAELAFPPAIPEARNDAFQLAAYQNLASTPNGPVPHPQQGQPGNATIRVDLAQGVLTDNGGYRLRDGDVVTVSHREKKMIYVSGLVSRPGQFEIPRQQDIHLLDAIALSGGLSSPVADKVIIIRRHENHPKPITIKASLRKAKKNGQENLRLAAGDTISVEQTPETVMVDVFTKLIRFSVGVAGRATLF